MSTVNIEGIDKVTLIQALHDGASTGRIPVPLEVLERRRLSRGDAQATVTMLEARRADHCGKMRIDYLRARPLKCDIAGPEMHTAGYNRDNGQGAAEAIVAKLRAGS